MFLGGTIESVIMHYGRFWWFLSQNWGNVFAYIGYNLDQIFEILASKIQNASEQTPTCKIFEIEVKL